MGRGQWQGVAGGGVRVLAAVGPQPGNVLYGKCDEYSVTGDDNEAGRGGIGRDEAEASEPKNKLGETPK